MELKLTRELLGTLGQAGWRPFTAWGIGLALVGLAWAFVFRFATGATTMQDFIALGGVVVPLLQQSFLRSAERMNGPPPTPPAEGLVNNAAIA